MRHEYLTERIKNGKRDYFQLVLKEGASGGFIYRQIWLAAIV